MKPKIQIQKHMQKQKRQKDNRQRRLEPGVGKMGQVHTQNWKDELATITETLGFT